MYTGAGVNPKGKWWCWWWPAEGTLGEKLDVGAEKTEYGEVAMDVNQPILRPCADDGHGERAARSAPRSLVEGIDHGSRDFTAGSRDLRPTSDSVDLVEGGEGGITLGGDWLLIPFVRILLGSDELGQVKQGI